MKNLNKRGFTLIELLAVIVLLAIVGIIGANLIITRLNKAKADTMINDFMDLQKEIAYNMTNGNVCGNTKLESEFNYKLQEDGNLGFYSAYDCTKYYDISGDDYKLMLMYGRKKYNKDGGEWTEGEDKYRYYINPNGQSVLLKKDGNKYYNTNDEEVVLNEGWKIKRDENYLQIQLGAKKTGKFKSVSFSKEQKKKICELSVKGECRIITTHAEVNAVIDVTREL